MANFPSETRLNDFRQQQGPIAQEFEHLYAQLFGYLSEEHNGNGSHTDVTAESLTLDDGKIALAAGPVLGQWVSVPFAKATFTAQTGNWTVASADYSFYLYQYITPTLVQIKGSFLSTTVSSTPTELRVTAPPRVTFSGHDSFGFTVYSQDGFSTQDTGQAIARAASNLLVFKPRTGGTWSTTTDLTGVIFTITAQVTEP